MIKLPLKIGRRISGLRSRRWRDESGQGLVYVLVIGAVLLMFVVALVDVLTKEMKWIVGAQKRSVLLHAADGAVDRAIYALQIGGNWDGIPDGSVTGYNQDVTYTDVPGVKYTIKVQEGNWTPGVQMGDPDMERTVTVFLSNTKTGERKKIQAVLLQTTLNSALFSGGQVLIGGSSEVHWGPVVSYSTASDSIEDPANWEDHPIYISKGGITFDKGASATSLGLDCADPIVGVCVNEYDTELGPTPPVDIDYMRTRAQEQNSSAPFHYYGPTSTPMIECGTMNDPALPSVMDKASYVFFDTLDGKNYDPDTDSICKGSYGGGNDRGCDIKFTGGCGQGFLVILGDLDLKGTGCGSVLMIAPADCVGKLEADPADCDDTPTTSMFWEGDVYIANTLRSGGTQTIYGSVFIGDLGAANITGNFSIYFKTGGVALGTLGKKVFTKLWLDRAPKADDVFP